MFEYDAKDKDNFFWDSHQTKIIELKTTIDQRNHVFICDSPQKNKTIQSKKQKDQGFSKGELQQSGHLMENYCMNKPEKTRRVWDLILQSRQVTQDPRPYQLR